ncbi:MAG: hypothetical protein ACOYOU_02015 [Kiritimatiellia bacterium]
MKHTFHLLPSAVLIVGLLLVSNGCRPQTPETQAAAEQRLRAEINQSFAKAETALAEGQTNAAVACIEAAATNQAFAAYRPQIFNSLLRLLLRVDWIEQARQHARAVSADPTLSAGACGLLYSYYREKGDTPNALAWSAEVSALPGIPAEVRRQAFTWHIEDQLGLRQDDQALDMLGKAFPVLKPAESLSLVRSSVETLFAAGRMESVDRFLAAAADHKPIQDDISRLTIAMHVRIASVRGDWAVLTNDFQTAISKLPDGELNSLFQTIIPVANAAGKQKVVDQCAELILFPVAASNAPSAVATASRVWCENTMASDTNALPGHLTALLRARVPAAQVSGLFNRFYYSFTEQPAPLKELMALGECLIPLTADTNDRSEIKVKVLDGCFLMQDYDRALLILESRIPGPDRDDLWHATSISKIKAHRALQKNEPRVAVGFFREFMKLLGTAKDDEVSDPVTNIRFPREMVLGRNAKRIGDILAAIPDAAEAAKAYAEARELYAKAIKNAKDPEATPVIEAELAQVPK